MKLSEMRLRSKGKLLVKSPIRGITKIRRNDPCFCGSKIKFKFCCWKKVTGNVGDSK